MRRRPRSPLNIELKSTAKANLLANLRMLAKIIQNSPTTTNAMRIELGLPQRGATPTPVPAPGTPFKFKVSLDQTGALTLGWKCENPTGSQGTIYQVWRKIASPGPAATIISADRARKLRRQHDPGGHGAGDVQNPGGSLDDERGLGAVHRQLRHQRQRIRGGDHFRDRIRADTAGRLGEILNCE